MNRSESAKKRWENPEYRQHQIDVQTKVYSDPIKKEENRKKALEAWKDPQYRDRVMKSMNQTRSTDEHKQKTKIAAITHWKDPNHRENAKIGANKRWEDPEERERARIAANNRPPVASTTKKKMRLSQMRAHELNPELTLRKIEGRIGGFWYGNVKYWYADSPQYCEKFNAEFKERVRAYWNYVCFECGTPQNGKKLGVHHIHYDKKMCCNGSPQDVVPLCRVCHFKTNYNRDYWEDHFTDLLYAYDPEGKCFFTKEEMKKFTSSIA